MMFPDRAPHDQYLYTTFVGGSRNRDLARASLYEMLQCLSFFLFQLKTSKIIAYGIVSLFSIIFVFAC